VVAGAVVVTGEGDALTTTGVVVVVTPVDVEQSGEDVDVEYGTVSSEEVTVKG
jgi:hypothetical protein